MGIEGKVLRDGIVGLARMIALLETGAAVRGGAAISIAWSVLKLAIELSCWLQEGVFNWSAWSLVIVSLSLLKLGASHMVA